MACYPGPCTRRALERKERMRLDSKIVTGESRKAKEMFGEEGEKNE